MLSPTPDVVESDHLGINVTTVSAQALP